jgi:4-hydroxy-tetrahydrodipicolinate reductase
MTTAIKTLRVVVHGASGKMGRETVAAVIKAQGMAVVGAVHRNTGGKAEFDLPTGGKVPLGSNVGAVLDATKPKVLIDFTNAEAAAHAMRAAIDRGIHVVTGTTGFADATLKELDAKARERGVGVVVAPNFALGAILLISLSRTVAKYFDYVDVIEAHHEAKIDAPSGTALAIARALAEGKGGPFTHPDPQKEPLPGTRGGNFQGVGVHSIRMPGRLAHHEVLLGTGGQTMSLRHDTLTRECYMPGVLMALREVGNRKGLVLGLDKLLGI